MNSDIICKFCRRPNHSLTYNCNCQRAGWTNKYRTLEYEIQSEEVDRFSSGAFREYSFFHPRGMLQHDTLPFNNYAEEDYPTVGLTPMYKLENLSRYYGAQIHLKDEGYNPSGSFKDRETLLCLLNSRHRQLNNATIFSSGNAAASASYFAKRTGQNLVAFVPGDTYPEKIEYIRSHGTDVIVIGSKQTGFERGYELYAALNAQQVFSNRGYDNWSVCNPYRTEGDKSISLEIVKQFSAGKKGTHVPKFVIVPTANGSCLSGIWKGFKELHQAGIILQLPRMIAVGIKNASPVAKAVANETTEHPVSCNSSKWDTGEGEVGSIIVAQEGYDSMAASEAVLESGGRAVELQVPDIERALVEFLELEKSLALEHNVIPEPAALTSLAAIRKLKESVTFSISDHLVSVATGDGLTAEDKLYSLLDDRPVLLQKAKHIINDKKRRGNFISSTKGKRINTEPNVEAVINAFTELQQQYVNV